MRKYLTYIFIFAAAYIFSGCADDSLPSDYYERIKVERERKNDYMKDPETSPMADTVRQAFDSLNYFPVDEGYKISAKLVRTPFDDIFEMPATGSTKDRFVRYGIAKFELEGEPVQLNIYENLEQKVPRAERKLFLPFKDKTSGKETYGGGRYLDMKKPEGDSIVIDFNYAYNPYCVYNTNFSCPLPPRENWLDVAIKAGEKDWEP